MTLVCITRTARLAIRIDVQDYSGYFPPVRAFAVGVKKPCIRDDMLLVIGHWHRIFWSKIGDIWIERRGLHDLTGERFAQFTLVPVHGTALC